MVVGCVSFLVGLGLARRVYFAEPLVVIVLAVAAILLFRKRNIVSLTCLVLVAVLGGLWRGSVYMQNVAVYDEWLKRPVVIEAVATSDAVYGERTQLSFTANQAVITDPEEVHLAGSLRVEGFGVPMVYKGDVVQVEGKLFPTRGANQARISFAELSVVRPGDSPIDSLRRRFVAGLQSVLPEPAASFGAGLLIGQRSTLPKETNDVLAVAGLTHLVAVSGYNLTILIGASRRLWGKRSKFQSALFSVALIVLFLLITGLSASIVRAAIVSLLSLGAWYYGREFKPLVLLALPAALTAGWNPFYVWSDIGWYLSFLAFFGVLGVAPLLARRLSKTGKVNAITAVLLESVSAQVLTLPLIMYIFGRMSVIGLLANVLVVPLVPLAMLGVLVAGIGGMVAPVISGWLAWPTSLVLTYMLDVAAALSRLPRAAIEQTLRWWQMVVFYGCIALATAVLWRRVPPKNDIMTEEVGA
jgi:competence protein ComEC